MARPQQPELARSARTDLDPDHVETGLQGQPTPKSGGDTGPVPAENQPGHHPAKEQDKPDLDAFAARLGTDPEAPTAPGGEAPPDMVGISAPHPEPGRAPEPRLVSLVLTPLRETVRRLEQLDRALTRRLTGGRHSNSVRG